jgi:hypothetical protein
MVLLSLRVIELCYLSNYRGVAVNYHCKFFITLAQFAILNMVAILNTAVISILNTVVIYCGSLTLERYCGKLPWYFYIIGPSSI